MVRGLKAVKVHFILFIVVIYLAIQKSHRKIVVKKVHRFVPDMKHILLWNNIHGLDYEGQEQFIERKCKYINCYLTMNKTYLEDLRYFDVILFNLQETSVGTQSLPNLRSSAQKYVFVANDSSDNFPVCDSSYDNFFNWTWSYRYDSFISYHFITVYNIQYEELGNHFQWLYQMKPIDFPLKSLLVTKSKAAVIFMDKCKSRSNRELIVQNLQKSLSTYNLTVDIFGACGPKKCKRTNMKPCFWRLRKNYYFYLAFEDSISEDYLTEIVLYAYDNNAVPIVYGGARYDRYLPPWSYIKIEDAKTEALAETINNLINNKEKYYDYFRWRNHYRVSKTRGIDVCALCDALNQPARLTQKVSYEKFRKWWNPLYENRCGTNMRFFHFHLM